MNENSEMFKMAILEGGRRRQGKGGGDKENGDIYTRFYF